MRFLADKHLLNAARRAFETGNRQTLNALVGKLILWDVKPLGNGFSLHAPFTHAERDRLVIDNQALADAFATAKEILNAPTPRGDPYSIGQILESLNILEDYIREQLNNPNRYETTPEILFAALTWLDQLTKTFPTATVSFFWRVGSTQFCFNTNSRRIKQRS